MPSTRSQGRAQPTLQFPRRKSSRVSSRSKKPEPQKSPAVSPIKPEPQAPGLMRIGPLSPRRPINLSTPLSPRRYTDQPTPLSPTRPVALSSPLSPRRTSAQPPAPSSPRLQSRIPLSPRKRTGIERWIQKLQLFHYFMQLCVLITFSASRLKKSELNLNGESSGLKFQILKSQPRVITNNSTSHFSPSRWWQCLQPWHLPAVLTYKTEEAEPGLTTKTRLWWELTGAGSSSADPILGATDAPFHRQIISETRRNAYREPHP